jgi:hypothetical protein
LKSEIFDLNLNTLNRNKNAPYPDVSAPMVQ